MSHPDFTTLELGPLQSGDAETSAETVWTPAEEIPVKAAYAACDRDRLDFVDAMPGLAPFHRGPYPTMYVQRPWTVRQYA
ncbi:MAG: methylmalonyl-CoA mutase family protein, partial [Oceanicaulis sp.]